MEQSNFYILPHPPYLRQEQKELSTQEGDGFSFSTPICLWGIEELRNFWRLPKARTGILGLCMDLAFIMCRMIGMGLLIETLLHSLAYGMEMTSPLEGLHFGESRC